MTEVKVGFPRELRMHFCLYLAPFGETEAGKERREEYKWGRDDVTSSGWSSATVSIDLNLLHANLPGLPAPRPLPAEPPPSHLSDITLFSILSWNFPHVSRSPSLVLSFHLFIAYLLLLSLSHSAFLHCLLFPPLFPLLLVVFCPCKHLISLSSFMAGFI